MKNKRINRISGEVKRTVSNIINNGLKDPRVSKMTSITKVNVTKDLKIANIYVSVLGDSQEKEETLKGLESAKGFIRKEIGLNLDIRYIPEPHFILDESIEQGIYMSRLIDKVNKEDENKMGKTDE